MEEENVNVTEEVTTNLENEKGEEIGLAQVQDFGALGNKSNTKTNIYTNIKDQKKIFNLESKVDNLLNDCENEIIKVKEVLIKRYEKPLSKPEVIKEAVIDENTGEILEDEVLKTSKISMACILIDDKGKSYATGSKIFTIQMIKYIEMFGVNNEGFEIKIIKNKMNEGKSLGFELV